MWLNFEVSYTDHKQIIGRSGSSINKIMRNTKSHIHLPDLNISSNSVRINEATVYGSPANIESARAEVRLGMNVTYCLEVNLKRLDIDLIPTAKHFSGPIEIFHHNKCLKVRGQTKHQKDLIKAVKFVLRWLKQNKYPVKSTYLRLEVTDIHRPWVCGENDENLQQIMKETGTKIEYHKRGDPPYRHQMTFTVYGDVEPIFYAREKLLGSLPVTLVFNASSKFKSPQDYASVNPEVSISSRRTKVGANTLYIRSRERNIALVYRAMQNFVESPVEVICKVPPQYQLSSVTIGRTPSPILICNEEVDDPKSISPKSSEAYGSDDSSLQSDHGAGWSSKSAKSGDVSSPRMSPPSSVTGVPVVPSNLPATVYPIPRYPWLDDYPSWPVVRPGGIENPFQSPSQGLLLCQSMGRKEPRVPLAVCPNCNCCCYLYGEMGFGSEDFFTPGRAPLTRSGQAVHPDGLWVLNMDKGHDNEKNSSSTFDYSSNRFGLDFTLIYRFLRNLNLEKYVGKFLSNDIDFTTLLTLTEDDLHSIGVTTFGAKRKLHIAIKALNEELVARSEMSSDPS